jgi:hypothetical protein
MAATPASDEDLHLHGSALVLRMAASRVSPDELALEAAESAELFAPAVPPQVLPVD